MPLSKAKDADRKREVRSVAFRAQAAAKQIAQGVVQPTNDAERKRREREDAEVRSVEFSSSNATAWHCSTLTLLRLLLTRHVFQQPLHRRHHRPRHRPRRPMLQRGTAVL